MLFFVYSRATASAATAEHSPALDEAHWAYMDGFAAGMIARGPTLGPDRETWTGSIHIVDLPSVGAAHRFVEEEPYNRAGLFESHLIRRFDNRLGRTMWEFPGGSDDTRFMVIAPAAPPDDPGVPPERLIVHGTLRTPDGARPAGRVLALQAPTRDAVAALVPFRDAEILDWEFGGRR